MVGSVSSGVRKSVRIKVESTWGVAPTNTGADLLERVTSTLTLDKDIFGSAAIREDQQVVDNRHGMQRIGGALTGEVSPKLYQALYAALLRQSFASAATTGALTNVTAAAGPPGTFTRAAGSYLTDGFKVGDVIRWAGWTTGSSAANNARNYRITALTATVMTVGTATTGAAGQKEAVIAQAAGDSVTATVVGKKLTGAVSNHTDLSYAIEHFDQVNTKSELFLGCVPVSAAFNIPPSGMATVAWSFMGRKKQNDTSAYFTSPTAAPNFGKLSGPTGLLRANGVDIGIIAGLNFTIVGGHQMAGPVVGDVYSPGITQGRVAVSGSGQMYQSSDSYSLRDLYEAETEFPISIMLPVGTAVNADFVNIYMPRCKLNSFTDDDGERALMRSFNFVALHNTSGGTGVTSDLTPIMIQDSQAV